MAFLAFDARGPAQQKDGPSMPRWSGCRRSNRRSCCCSEMNYHLRAGRGWLAIALGSLFGIQGNTTPADPREAALRPLVALARNDRVSMPAREIIDFLSAGFTAGQYRTMLASIRMASLNGPLRA